MTNKRIKNKKFNKSEEKIDLSQLFDDVANNGMSITHLPKFLFLCILFILFIFFNHSADRTVAEIKILKNEVGNLKAEYRTIHSKYRNSRLQSSIAKSVKKLGIVENETPPLKIEIKTNETQ